MNDIPLFQVCKGGMSYMGTYQFSCIYDKDTLASMSAAGYKFKLNGKAATAAQVVQFVNDNKNNKSR